MTTTMLYEGRTVAARKTDSGCFVPRCYATSFAGWHVAAAEAAAFTADGSPSKAVEIEGKVYIEVSPA